MNRLRIRIISGWLNSGQAELAGALLKAMNAQNPGSTFITSDDGHNELFDQIRTSQKSNQAAPAVRRAAASDCIVISAPLVEPAAIAELFDSEAEMEMFELAGLITVVDATRLLADLAAAQDLSELGLQYDELDDRTVADVLVEQIEFADVVVLQGLRALEGDSRVKVRQIAEWLNPSAEIIEVEDDQFSSETASAVLRATTGRFYDEIELQSGSGWMKLIDGNHPMLDRGLGMSGFCFKARRPFHPERLAEFFSRLLESGELVRIKGWIWVATRHDEVGLWCLAGGSMILLSAGAWMAATPMRLWPEDPLDRESIMQDWIAPHGDRRQEIALMGFHLSEIGLRRELKACLLTDDEFTAGPEVWRSWPDRLPDWSGPAEDDDDGFTGPLN